MAWMRMMGADSVGYHERTVLGREDDPVGNALEYYASRGEAPMAWGGAGAAWLGLDGEVDIDEWRAVFGTGGARHPESGERLVHCMRPGMELVVSPHKSIAELGVIGRVEDMHTILDAERSVQAKKKVDHCNVYRRARGTRHIQRTGVLEWVGTLSCITRRWGWQSGSRRQHPKKP